MKVAQNVADVLERHVVLEVEGIDRMYLNVYVPQLQWEYGVVEFFRQHRKQAWASSALMSPISRRFVAGLEAYAKENGIEVVHFRRGQRKDDVMAERLKKFSGEEGIVFLGKAQEKATVFRTEKRRNPKTGQSYPWIVKSSAVVNQYYLYAVDRDFGPFFLKFCSYFPYNGKLCLNGHEYAKRQLARRGIAFEALDNGVLSCADPKRLQAICADLSAEKIDALLRKWLRRLPHPFTAADRKAGYGYAISILQAEFSLTQVLDRPVHGRMFFEEVIRENLDLGRPDEVQLIFDRKIRRNTPGRFRTRVVTEGVTPSLNLYYKNTRIKQYHKEGRALRTETTINNAGDFRVGKRLHNLPRLREIGFQANHRLLEVERVTHDCILAEETFRTLNGPVQVNGQRASALRFADPKVQALWHALVLFRVQTLEFRHADLRGCWAALIGRNPSEVSQGAITYQLRRLRLHGMIERAPHTYRYRVTPMGLRTALFCTRSYTRLLRPGLAFALPGHQAIAMPLKRAFDNFETEVQACIQRANLAA
jgi:hypothetical protein